MAGQKQQAELIVFNRRKLAAQQRRLSGRTGSHRLASDVGFLAGRHPAVTQSIERTIARHLEQPRLRIFGNAAIRPLLHRRDQRVLNGIFGER